MKNQFHLLINKTDSYLFAGGTTKVACLGGWKKSWNSGILLSSIVQSKNALTSGVLFLLYLPVITVEFGKTGKKKKKKRETVVQGYSCRDSLKNPGVHQENYKQKIVCWSGLSTRSLTLHLANSWVTFCSQNSNHFSFAKGKLSQQISWPEFRIVWLPKLPASG